VLTGVGEPGAPGLEELLDGIAEGNQVSLRGIERLFDAQDAPEAFLDWLSDWVALTLRADIGPARQRDLIANAVPLYRLRGTKAGLQQLLQIYTTPGVTITERAPRLQVGVHSTVGVDTVIDGGLPNYFRVTIRLDTTNPSDKADRQRIAKAIIDAEKPAHTYYTLRVETPTLQIGVTSTVGVDTLLGEAS
jgi:phage tail-like protein